MLSMQRGCISTVNVILHARAVSSARCTVVVAVVTQNGKKKTTLSYIIFSISSLLSRARASVFLSVSFLAHINRRCFANVTPAFCSRFAIYVSSRCGFETDNLRHNGRSLWKTKKRKKTRSTPDARNCVIFEQTAFINHDSSFLWNRLSHSCSFVRRIENTYMYA